MTFDTLLDRAEQAVRRGELWRAKEVLQGAIRAGRYDLVLFERLGLVLLRMGDLPEAGKYLFLSGVRKSSYEEPIALYINRYAGKAAKQRMHLYYTFPRAARLAHREDYPAAVATQLAALGLPEKLPAPRRSAGAASAPFAAKLMGFGCFAFIAVGVGLAVLGVIKIVEWVRG